MTPEEGRGVGLCAMCRHVRVVQTRTGSRFYLCRRSETDARYPRYPGLPVLECPGFASVSPTAEKNE